jgi:DeoR family transcriptional regulator of aga operon/DeoR family fructose operon transcriptional repressor
MVKKIFALDRQNKILDYLQEKKTAEVEELSLQFNVTQTTIRRDLAALDSQGQIFRTHGGAMFKKPLMLQFTPLSNRLNINYDEKKRIGAYLAKFLINDNDTIMIDGGSTTIIVAKEIAKQKQNLVIITNSSIIGEIFVKHKESQNKVLLTGGELSENLQTEVGLLAERAITTFRVNKAIIGVSGIIPNEGVFACDPEEGEIKRLMIENANSTIVVADNTKLTRNAFTFIDKFSAKITLVTDQSSKKYNLDPIKESGSKIVFV